MQLRSGGFWISFCVGFLIIHGPAQSAVPDKFIPADFVTPEECPKYYKYTEANCEPKLDEIKKLEKENCSGPGLKLNDDVTTKDKPACVAEDDVKKKPEPQCKPWDDYTPKISGTGADAKCSYERKVSTSSPGDYIGDCFHIKALPDTPQIKAGYYFVTNQKTTADDDQKLTLVTAHPSWYNLVGCGAPKGPQHKVLASQLMEAGASRSGYAYGILTMPYKYYPSAKSFEVNVPIGGYLGYRYGRAGSGTTAALAVTLSSVKANTVDPTILNAAGKPTVTGTTNVAALSGAFGFIFDLLKSPKGKAFKAGLFVGKDIVNDDPSIDYRFNRKTWFAIQLGYDFTDN